MNLGLVHHVKSLEEAFMLYAAARATGNALPTFTTTIEEWPTFADDVKHSYTLEHEHNGQKHRWTGVMIHVMAISQQADKAPQ